MKIRNEEVFVALNIVFIIDLSVSQVGLGWNGPETEPEFGQTNSDWHNRNRNFHNHIQFQVIRTGIPGPVPIPAIYSGSPRTLDRLWRKFIV